MKLYFAAASPFVRKVHMSAIELGLVKQIELVSTHVSPGKENATYTDGINPLGKIPALEIDDGSIILDSSVICEYLNHLEGNNTLIPERGPERWRVQTGHAIANGIMDAAVSNRYETFMRPEEYRWDLWVNEQWAKINQALQWFENQKSDSMETIDQISLACALGYLDFRFADFAWRERYAHLSLWHQRMSETTAYRETAPD